jgi:hypothetical protein
LLRQLAQSKAALSLAMSVGPDADLEGVLTTVMARGQSRGKPAAGRPPSGGDGHRRRRWIFPVTVSLAVVSLLIAGGAFYLPGWAKPGAWSATADSAAACVVATVTDTASTMTAAHGGAAVAASYGISGPLGGYALAFDGSLSWLGSGGPATSAPQILTELAWFRTFSPIIEPVLGSANKPSPREATAADRALWLNGGQVVAGVYSPADNLTHELISPSSYDDGKWHLAAVTLSGSGFALYVDGGRVAILRSVTSAQSYSGWWTIGTANLGSWPHGLPARGVGYWHGNLAGVAVLPAALTAGQIRDLYTSGTFVAYGTAVTAKNPIHYWGLQDVTPRLVDVPVTGRTTTCPSRS